MPAMSPWFVRAVVILGTILLIAIPATLHRREAAPRVVKSRKGILETGLMALASLGFLSALIWVATPFLAFADYPLRPIPLAAGIACLGTGLWLHYRAHADLGRSWSISLEVREGHRLVTHGIYRRIRHPMYLALLLYSSGQAMALPNWVAGPSYFLAIALLFTFRVGPEERMMLEEFGDDYAAYIARSKRLVPGVW